MKACKACGIVKPLVDFSIARALKDGRRPNCKPCERERASRWYADNPAKARSKDLMKVYGITEADYQDMHAAQQGLCAICRQPETTQPSKPGRRPPRLSVDHNHRTGKVRGLLCKACNQSIGMMREDPALLQAAVDYLKTHNV